MSATFERIVRVKPAFDCVVVQPCVHGSKDCGTVPGASHGRHNAELLMSLRSAVAEVVLVVNTGWELPQTPASVRLAGRDRPSGAFVEFHSSMPQYEGHEPEGSTCDLWPVCYGNAGYGISEKPTELLVSHGSDAVWEWLEATYREHFEGGAA